jgi:hypothetical protein
MINLRNVDRGELERLLHILNGLLKVVAQMKDLTQILIVALIDQQSLPRLANLVEVRKLL